LPPAAALEAAAVEPALAEPERAQWLAAEGRGEFRNKNTFIDDFLRFSSSSDPPQFLNGGPQVLVKNTFLDIADLAPPPIARASTVPSAPHSSESPIATPRSEKPEPVTQNGLPQHTPQVTIEKTFLHFADPPANASQLSVNSEPRNCAPQVFIPRNEAKTPETTVVISLHEALGAPSTSSPTSVHPGASYSTSPPSTSSPTSFCFFAICIPPFPIASSRSSPSQPVRLPAENFPVSSLP